MEGSLSPISPVIRPGLRPPTPAASPAPVDRIPLWQDAEDPVLRDTRAHFAALKSIERQRYLAELLNLCTSYELASVAAYVSPRLKKDFLKCLPVELALRILTYIDDPKTLARSAQVSKYWHALLNDDLAWKRLCRLHRYRRLSSLPTPSIKRTPTLTGESPYFSAPEGLGVIPLQTTTRISTGAAADRKAIPTSYKSHFKQRYMIDANWRSGGTTLARHITDDFATVTWSTLTDNYIVLGLDNAKIYVFARDGRFLRTLSGHESGVWTLDVIGDTLVSGGCDKVLRSWDLPSGKCLRVMRGHTSTVRCIEIAKAIPSTSAVSGQHLVVSGSRDATIRVWDYDTGLCKHVLIGHTDSVRCLKVSGDMVASGSYDLTCKLWSLADGSLLRTFSGHAMQIYSIGFNGSIIATGSLDATIRVWSVKTGECLGKLSGHTSLVGQLQMRHPLLVTGGPDGSIRVWNLDSMKCIHHLAGHDNSVTTLQFDDNRIVSGSSDGLTKVWDLETGALVRELTEQSQQVWRVAFSDDIAVVMCMREDRSCLEVISFFPRDQVEQPVRELRPLMPGDMIV
ncbi:WD40-repeat-containing domain protein [Protomyces lactucae-debilis]|uniref:WD40-repeat-containing domain protein n=1 Tax=Protomyces lactucae-debilis TaxID=2754530 RepID=A0A1Y2FPW6_PROLT|nr:WD40-repeat-containing domain protein [Protomyces lactucae-debilis]ORY84755.1 WD40-repeat-containing domain protein [Protomyces lactucae-debilis]